MDGTNGSEDEAEAVGLDQPTIHWFTIIGTFWNDMTNTYCQFSGRVRVGRFAAWCGVVSQKVVCGVVWYDEPVPLACPTRMSMMSTRETAQAAWSRAEHGTADEKHERCMQA